MSVARVPLAALIGALPARLGLSAPPGAGEILVAQVRADSRQVQPGDVFVAYRGVDSDGHRFAAAAVRAGAAAVVAERQLDGLGAVPLLLARDGREAFAWLCAARQDHPSRALRVAGITGTDGKTTTSTLLHAMLMAAGRKTGLISTVSAIIGDATYDTGLHTTTPNADDVQRYLAQMRDSGTQDCVLEVTSHGLAQHRVDGTEFRVAVITNITHDHLDLHGTHEAYRAAKTRLFELVARRPDGIAVLNADDAYSFEHLRAIGAARQIIYSRDAAAASRFRDTLVAERILHAPDGLRVVLNGPGGRLELHSRLIGDFNVSNVLAATAAAIGMDVPGDAIIRGVAQVGGVPGRMERIDAGQPYMAVVDFAHTPNALEQCLSALSRIKGAGRLIVVFGCAGERDPLKRPLMAATAARLADVAIFTAEDPRREPIESIFADMLTGVPPNPRANILRVPDRGEALACACQVARPGDIVVACGKGHEQSMCFGTIERPWDDRVALRRAITAQSGAQPIGPKV